MKYGSRMTTLTGFALLARLVGNALNEPLGLAWRQLAGDWKRDPVFVDDLDTPGAVGVFEQHVRPCRALAVHVS